MTRPVDVLFLCRDLDMGGAERHWASLLPELRAYGIAPRLVALEGGGRSLDTLREADVAVEDMRDDAIGLFDNLPLLSLRRFPRTLVDVPRPDVLVSWSYTAHLTGALFARSRRVPHVINWHRQPGNYGTRLEEASTEIAVKLGAGAIAVTDAQRPDLRAMGMPETRIRVVHNGTPEPAAAGADRAGLRSELGFSDQEVLAVLVARLRPEKRIGDFIAAVARAREGGAKLRGVVLGDGPEFESLSRQAADSGGAVSLVGYQPDPSRYITAADIVVLASEYEALPMTLIEAAACGTPTIATDVGGVNEIVVDDETGLLVPPGNTQELAAALTRLSSNPTERRAMGEAARARWIGQFTFDGMVSEYARLLANVSGPPAKWGVG